LASYDDEDDYYYQEDELVLQIGSLLSKSFKKTDNTTNEHYRKNSICIYESSLLEILLGDNNGSSVVCVALKDGSPGFGFYTLARTARKLFDDLFDVYGRNIFVRTGPWTSELYIPSYMAGGKLFVLDNNIISFEKNNKRIYIDQSTNVPKVVLDESFDDLQKKAIDHTKLSLTSISLIKKGIKKW